MPVHKIRKEAEKKIKRLKEKHAERVKYFRKLEKAGKTGEMEKKLKEWKNKGYNTLLLESKLGSLSSREMRDLMKEWKGKYKNT